MATQVVYTSIDIDAEVRVEVRESKATERVHVDLGNEVVINGLLPDVERMVVEIDKHLNRIKQSRLDAEVPHPELPGRDPTGEHPQIEENQQ
jgi:hypothetical protein